MNTRQTPQETRSPCAMLIVGALVAFVVFGTIAPILSSAYGKLAASVAMVQR